VLTDHGQYNALVRLKISNGPFLVRAHEGAVTGDIGSEDRREPSGNLIFRGN